MSECHTVLSFRQLDLPLRGSALVFIATLIEFRPDTLKWRRFVVNHGLITSIKKLSFGPVTSGVGTNFTALGYQWSVVDGLLG